MSDISQNWDASFSVIDAAITLTEGVTESNTSAELDLDGKSVSIVTIDADYSDHAKATGGLVIRIIRAIDASDYESDDGAAIMFEMPFTQNGTERKSFPLSANQFSKFKLKMDWLNSTSGSSVTIATAIKYAVGQVV
ncbi:MAG: hypothetical protein JRI80_00205 [Deltaproteobacteria bacterium]|nr:hypothetical protein [Deltaproteobacteria bacterium]